MPTKLTSGELLNPSTHEAIDSVRDFDPATSRLSITSADKLLEIVSHQKLKIKYIIETHAHADHLTAAKYLQGQLVTRGQPRPSISIGKCISQVQATFARKYHVGQEELNNVFENLWDDNETFTIRTLKCEVLHLPGHTTENIGYRIEETVFTGDSIFNPDVGSARADFPGGSAMDLYHSTQTLLSLPVYFRLYTRHDYPPDSRAASEIGEKVKAYTTVEEQRENKHVKIGTDEGGFVIWRRESDAQLGEPRVLHQALPFNIRGGRLLKATQGGDRVLKAPLKVSDALLGIMQE